VSASIKQPNAAYGLGYWPAFWLLGQGTWPQHGEIDILEAVNQLDEHSGTFHCGSLPDGALGPCGISGLSDGFLACPACQSNYQTYSVIIDRRNPSNEQLLWYLNGREFFSVSENQVGTAPWRLAVDHGFLIIFDNAIGGQYPDWQCGCIAPSSQTTSGGTMSVRYVSVYELVTGR
jgi:beta-glucanase (GH16 family)